jgi:hypothetical protein
MLQSSPEDLTDLRRNAGGLSDQPTTDKEAWGRSPDEPV